MGIRTAMIMPCLLVGLIGATEAGVIAAVGGYEVDYQMVLTSPTPTGGDIQGVFIFEWNGSSSSIAHSFTIAGSGETSLSHIVDFAPTTALVIGYLDAVEGIGDGKRHLYTLVSPDFLNQDRQGKKFSEIFGVGEQATIDLLIDAAGDSGALQSFTETVNNRIAPLAAFDPAGGFRVLHWSAPVDVGGNIPEPTIATLMGIGLAGLVYRRRKQNKTA